MAAVRSRVRLGRYRSARGAELVEFAIVFPLVLIGIVSLIEMGLLFNQYEALTNAAREGARLAAIPGWVEGDVKDRVAAYAGAAGMDPALVRSGTLVQPVTVTAGARTINSIRVSIEYPYGYSILAPVLRLAGAPSLSTLTLKAAATMRSEVVAGL